MKQPRLAKGQRRILIVALLVVAVLLFARLYRAESAPLPPQAVPQALSNTFSAPSFRFSTVSTVLLSGQQRLFCSLEGEASGNDRHIFGELLGTPLNIYLVEEALYQQNGRDKSWRKIAEADLAEARRLLAEIAPEANFSYSETGPLTYLGTEEIAGMALHKFEFQPVMADVWIEQYFTDIVSTLWLDEKGQYVVKAQITAVSAENPSVSLIVDNTFSGFGEALEIIAPL